LGAGITDIAIPGVPFQQQLKVPDDESGSFDGPTRGSPVIVLDRPLANVNLSLGLSETDDPAMARQFTIPKAMTANVSGYAVPVPGTTLDQLLDSLTRAPATSLKVTASSQLGDLPRFRPENLVSDSSRPWLANYGDTTPSLELSWDKSRTINSIALTLSAPGLSPHQNRHHQRGGDAPGPLGAQEGRGDRLPAPDHRLVKGSGRDLITQ
jgi:hypothetical protein